MTRCGMLGSNPEETQMARKRGFKRPKDPFSALPETFKDACAAAQTDELQGRLASTAKDEEENQSAKRADQQLKEKAKEYQLAGQVYKEATKLNKLKTQYVIRILADRGDQKCQEILKLNAAKAI